MIDLFTIALTHGLIALAALRLLSRDELDREQPLVKPGAKQDTKPGRKKDPASKSRATSSASSHAGRNA